MALRMGREGIGLGRDTEGILRGLRELTLSREETLDLMRELLTRHLAADMTGAEILADEDALRMEESHLLQQRQGIDARISDIQRKLRVRDSVDAEVERRMQEVERILTTAQDGLPGARGPVVASAGHGVRGRRAWSNGVWFKAEISYSDGRTFRPSYLSHGSPMDKLAEACGCYVRPGRQLVCSHLGRDAVITVPAGVRTKPRPRSRGESIRVTLSDWRPLE